MHLTFAVTLLGLFLVGPDDDEKVVVDQPTHQENLWKVVAITSTDSSGKNGTIRYFSPADTSSLPLFRR
jgi:hypothetical protein